ncbi:unnamed protein product [Echinostoma caproni]|uniref:Reverse transcriptase domain-containing protein n=1 Tax=Echinostoma caproni TaxID=27848 RepID=A0A183A6X0_9TREM|nr:unnamed protein product [Echinostoma caproni]
MESRDGAPTIEQLNIHASPSEIEAPDKLPDDSLEGLLLGHLLPTEFQAYERAKFNSFVHAKNINCRDFILQLNKQRLIGKCSSNFGGMNVQPAKLEVDGEPIFMKRRVIPYDQREGVLKAIEKMER